MPKNNKYPTAKIIVLKNLHGCLVCAISSPLAAFALINPAVLGAVSASLDVRDQGILQPSTLIVGARGKDTVLFR